MKRSILIFSLLAGLFVFGTAYEASAQTVSGSIGRGVATRGQTVRATVVMSIPGNLHVNSNRPASEYSIPTTVKLSGQGVKVGAVSYPRGRNRKFSFSANTINVYEGRVVFTFNVTVPKGFKGNNIKVNAAVRYQACTDEVCYAPKTQNISLTARVR